MRLLSLAERTQVAAIAPTGDWTSNVGARQLGRSGAMITVAAGNGIASQARTSRTAVYHDQGTERSPGEMHG